MLAHLAHPELRISLRYLTAATIALALGMTSRVALAADALPMGSLDAHETGHVISGDLSKPGTLTTTLNFAGDASPVREGALANPSATPAPTAKPELLSRANRGSVMLGMQIAARVDFTLGLHGTYEQMRPSARDGLAPATAQMNWHQSFKQSGFAGASLLAKLGLLDAQGFKLALAPFAESGAGAGATYALTRSVGAKAGFIAIASYGTRGVAQLDMNAGARYRDPEVAYGMTLRNEEFAGANLKAFLTRDVDFFLGADARRIMVAPASSVNALSTGSALSYQPRQASDATVGVTAAIGDAEFTAYGARGFNQGGSNDGFGYGERAFGLSMSYASGRGDKMRPSYATDIDRRLAAKGSKDAKLAATNMAQEKTAETPAPGATAGVKTSLTAKPGVPGAPAAPAAADATIGAGFDPLKAIGTSDDFRDLDKRAAQYQKDASAESEDARIERELAEIKDAEAKAEAARAKVNAAEKTAAQKAKAAAADEDDKLLREWQQEAQKKADSLDTISKDEMNWNGLGE